MPTDIPWVAVFGAVFFAALIQSMTGIGFGLIATPFLLIALTGSSAVQITIILSVGMSVMLSGRCYQDCDFKVLRVMILGAAVGLPIGLVAIRLMDPVGLRLLAGSVVLWFAASIARRPITSTDSKRDGPRSALFGVSILSGAMGVCLAMPGPAVIGSLRARCDSDQSVRATLFAYFVPTYAAAFALQLGFTELRAETVWTSLILVPAMMIGIMTGHALAPRLSQRQNKVIIVLILIATSLTLIVTTIFRALELTFTS